MTDVPVTRDLGLLAPAFRRAVDLVVGDLVAAGWDPWVFETVRTKERQAFLYAKGRTLPGSVVTKAQSHLQSWHGHGLAVDIISRAKHWDAPTAFWNALGAACSHRGLTWGGTWVTIPDQPHCQWGKCPAGPTKADKARTDTEGMRATWTHYEATP